MQVPASILWPSQRETGDSECGARIIATRIIGTRIIGIRIIGIRIKGTLIIGTGLKVASDHLIWPPNNL